MKTIITHSGTYHADDVFAIGTLLLIYPDAVVERTRDEERIKSADCVVDVGGSYDPEKQRFDHHQRDGAGKRENGIPYASFGLVWKTFGEKLAGDTETVKMIDDLLVAHLDSIDNGISIYAPLIKDIRPYDMSDLLDSYATGAVTEENFKEAFFKVVKVAQDIIVREIDRAHFKIEARKKVEEAYESAENKRIVILKTALPWKEALISKPDVLFVIYPIFDGRYAAQGVPREKNSFEVRVSYPEAWRGKNNEELASITGVTDAKFAHRSGHLAASGSLLGAIALAEKAINSA